MSARLVSFVASEGVALDQLSGRVTAFNMIDYVLVAAIPSQLMRLSTVSQYELGSEPDAFVERVSVIAPDGTSLNESQSSVSTQARVPGQLPNGHRSIHSVWRVVLPMAGDYRVILEKQVSDGSWEKLSSLCITVLVQQNAILNAYASPFSVPPMPAAPGSTREG